MCPILKTLRRAKKLSVTALHLSMPDHSYVKGKNDIHLPHMVGEGWGDKDRQN